MLKKLEVPVATNAFFSEIRESLEEFLNPEKVKRTEIVNYFKAQIPKDLPDELRSIMRRGVYRIAQAPDLRQANNSLGMMEKKYRETELFVRRKLRNKKMQA